MNVFKKVGEKVSRLFSRNRIVRTAVVLAVLSMTTTQLFAAQANLTWEPSASYADGTLITAPIGYKVHQGTTSGNYNQIIDVGPATTYAANNLADDTSYYFTVSAYDQAGVESVLSNEMSKTTPPLIVTYDIIAIAGAGGSISPASAVITAGSSQTVAISPASGYRIAGVTVDGTPVGAVASYTFNNVSANHTISASFAQNVYTINAFAGAGGSVSPTSATVYAGASKSFTITPASGYRIASVTVDGSQVGAVSSYSFNNVTTDHTISATFAQSSYTITASASAGGSISPAGAVTVTRGSSKSFTIVPASGYRVASVSVDGTNLGAVTSYTFSNVTANHTISASFSVNPGTIMAAINCGGQAYSASGTSFKADSLYSGGSPNAVTMAISGTTDQALYQSWRYGTSFTYSLAVPNGNYNITLKFAENFATKVGQRVFNVQAQGQTVLSNLDIFAKVGTYKAYDVIIPVTVSNGTISLKFSGSVGNAIISGIVVKSI